LDVLNADFYQKIHRTHRPEPSDVFPILDRLKVATAA
jgi:hypothetical protein